MRLAVAAATASLAAAGCSAGSRPAAIDGRGDRGRPTSGTHYAALFEDGRTYRYQRVSEILNHDRDDPRADESGNVRTRSEHEVTCQGTARRFGDVEVAMLSCTPDEDDELADALTALYVANSRGVFRVDMVPGGALPADAALARALVRGQARPLLPPAPARAEQRDENEEGGRYRKVSSATTAHGAPSGASGAAPWAAAASAFPPARASCG